MQELKKKKIYLSGILSNGGKLSSKQIEKNKQIFYDAKEFYKSIGFEVVNPLDINTEEKSWEGYMLADIKALFKCDEICMLPGWINSKGARIERAISIEMNIKTNNVFKRCLKFGVQFY